MNAANTMPEPAKSANHADDFFNLGNACIPLQQFEEALAYYEQALAIQPDHAAALSNRGNIFIILNRFEEALDSFEQALTIQPNYVDALINRGTTLLQLQRFEEALGSFDHALTIQPEHANALAQRGNLLLLHLNRFEEALVSLDHALTLRPDDAVSMANRGAALHRLHRFEEALVSYNLALTIHPNNVEILSSRGILLQQLHRSDEALANFDHALALHPDYLEVLCNRSTILIDRNRFEEALINLDHALALRPNYLDAIYNRATALLRLNRFDEALVSFERVLEMQPDHIDANWNESICRLTMGDFALGWQKHEWRWKQKQCIESHHFSQPMWLGKESLHNKTILLHAEQGLGDTIQFCRYAPLLANMGATVLLAVQPSLTTLLRYLPGVTAVFAQGEALPNFDLHCPLLSLPLACNTDLTSIPFGTPSSHTKKTVQSFITRALLHAKHWLFHSPLTNVTNTTHINTDRYLKVSTLHQTVWKNKLGNKTLKTLPRIGLTWSGNSAHQNDCNRSIPLINFVEILNTQKHVQAQFYCLQTELRPGDQALINQQNNLQNKIAFLGDELNDFADTAALIDCMDLIITVDTSIAHLAGALGKPVWILLPFNADWRWLINRNDSPWYPSARLFRQPAIGDWDSVITQVKKELVTLISPTSML